MLNFVNIPAKKVLFYCHLCTAIEASKIFAVFDNAFSFFMFFEHKKSLFPSPVFLTIKPMNLIKPIFSRLKTIPYSFLNNHSIKIVDDLKVCSTYMETSILNHLNHNFLFKCIDSDSQKTESISQCWKSKHQFKYYWLIWL